MIIVPHVRRLCFCFPPLWFRWASWLTDWLSFSPSSSSRWPCWWRLGRRRSSGASPLEPSWPSTPPCAPWCWQSWPCPRSSPPLSCLSSPYQFFWWASPGHSAVGPDPSAQPVPAPTPSSTSRWAAVWPQPCGWPSQEGQWVSFRFLNTIQWEFISLITTL